MRNGRKLSRRTFIFGLSMGVLGLNGSAVYSESVSASLVVSTPSGPMRGVSVNGVNIFRGVPFAEPPVGPLRFRPTVKPSQWAVVLDATEYGPAPWQEGFTDVRRSEDCLYLNIWAPAGKGPFPVFVWIHGGGLTGGYAADGMFKNNPFAREDIVVVTVGYRLGVFGFLDFERLLGPAYAGTANNGLRDVVVALEWVQANIEAVGGDPSRVTVGGESAGAKLTGLLMGVPSARNLFSQMISESGGAERAAPRSASLDLADQFAAAWSGRSNAVSDLLTSPAPAIIEAQSALLNIYPKHFPLRCEVDGSFIPQPAIDTIRQGNTKGKRLLIGTNHDESALFFHPTETRDVQAADLANATLAQFQSVLDGYEKIYPQMTPVERRIRALTAEEYWIPSTREVDAHVGAGGKAWMYRLDFTESSGPLAGFAFHSLDLGMVWGKPHPDVSNAADEASLAAQMTAAWAAFIRGESPDAAGLPDWPEYNAGARPTMVLDMPQSHTEYQPQQADLQLWTDVM